MAGFERQISDEEYGRRWSELGPIEVRMIERYGKCKHEVGDAFRYDHPYNAPQGICHALLHVLDLYVWRVAMGFPSWEDDDRGVYRIHCPSKTGAVWEMRKCEAEPNLREEDQLGLS